MTAFLVLAAVLVAGALLFVVPPLLRRGARPGATRDAVNAAVYRDQLRELDVDLRAGTLAADQHEKARREIEARLLADVGKGDAPAQSSHRTRAAAIALGLAVPICALSIYLAVGNPRAIVPQAVEGGSHDLTAQQFEALVSRLAVRLKDNPEDAEGWMMLGRSYAVLGRFGEASEAYAKAASRMPRDAQLLADYADALAMAQGKTLRGEPEKILLRALAIDPNNVKALLLAGTAAFNRNNYSDAIRHWERVLGLLPPEESNAAQRVRASLAEARALNGTPGGKAQIAKPAQAQGGSRVSGVVSLAPALAGKVAPNDTVFIFARAAEGPRMPLAILRKRGSDLPVEFTLDDSMAMAPQMNLSAFPRVVIGARVSKSANANPQPGDLQGSSAPINVGTGSITVVIDTELREAAGR